MTRNSGPRSSRFSAARERWDRSQDDAAFVQFVDAIIRENRGGLQETFLMLREQLGRYPTFEELSQVASSMAMGIASDIK